MPNEVGNTLQEMRGNLIKVNPVKSMLEIENQLKES